jgi:hypothetical protein
MINRVKGILATQLFILNVEKSARDNANNIAKCNSKDTFPVSEEQDIANGPFPFIDIPPEEGGNTTREDFIIGTTLGSFVLHADGKCMVNCDSNRQKIKDKCSCKCMLDCSIEYTITDTYSFDQWKDIVLKMLIYATYPDGKFKPFDISGSWNGDLSTWFPKEW